MGLKWDDFSPEEQEQMRREKAARQQLALGGSAGSVPGTSSGGGSIFDPGRGMTPQELADQKERLFRRATLAERYAVNRGWDGTEEGAEEIIWPGEPGWDGKIEFSDPVIYGGPNAGKNPFEVPSNESGGLAPPVQWGGGNPNPLAPVTEPTGGGQAPSDIGLVGFEGYSPETRDFYRQQFQTMRQRKAGEDQKEMAAALRRYWAGNAQPPEATDPWAWAGGEEQFTPRVVDWDPESSANYSWRLREGIEPGMTNREIADYLFSQNVMAPELQTRLRQAFQDPSRANETSWSRFTTPEQFKQAITRNNPNASPQYLEALRAVPDAMFLRSDIASTGGPAAAAGYAAPIGRT